MYGIIAIRHDFWRRSNLSDTFKDCFVVKITPRNDTEPIAKVLIT